MFCRFSVKNIPLNYKLLSLTVKEREEIFFFCNFKKREIGWKPTKREQFKNVSKRLLRNNVYRLTAKNDHQKIKKNYQNKDKSTNKNTGRQISCNSCGGGVGGGDGSVCVSTGRRWRGFTTLPLDDFTRYYFTVTRSLPMPQYKSQS